MKSYRRTMLLLLATNVLLLSAIWLPPARSAESAAPGPAFDKLVADSWEFDLREDPLFASQTGDHRFDDKLPAVSVADAQRRLTAKREFQHRWQAIDRAKLPPAKQLDYEIFGLLLANEIAEGDFQSYLVPITNRSGFHVEFPELARDTRLDTVADYEHYIARLRGFQRYAQGHIELMRAGIKAGLSLPQVVLSDYQTPLSAHIVSDPTRSLLYGPLKKFPERIESADRERLAAAARTAIAESVVPGYREFLKFMTDEYVPQARSSIGASALPRGREFYRHRVHRFTSLELAPEQVHELGQSEVRRIEAEMLAAVKRAGFEGSKADFVEHLRSDPKFYPESAEELMKEAAYILKRVDGQLPKLFKTLPRMPCGLREVPAYIAAGTTTAYYSPPSGDGLQPGFYYVNTYNLKSRPLYEMEALSLHEAVPGHHLQLALQHELGELPAFRRFADFTAFIEGWGLYAERLGLEMGFYQDPHADFGRLSYEMWRACRLVVDTGLHYQGWTRQQAIDFMAQHTALTLHNIRAEVDRYISWPGQALAYKLGELKIRELRKRAEERLGQQFDVRQFHEVVLSQGAVPLAVLERNVEAYLAQIDSSPAAKKD